MNQQDDMFHQLQREMRACRRCIDAGYEAYPEAVTQGARHALMMTIGQAPGITEMEAKRPFNAGSGARLFQWLEKAGIQEDWFRSTQYMSSVTKCYPGKAPSGGGDRVPSRQEQAFCRSFLDREIEIVNPRLIIPIGRLAITLFYPKSLKLDEIIGTEIQLDGRWIIPLPHSSGASRWHQIQENRNLIEKAITQISARYHQLFPDNS